MAMSSWVSSPYSEMMLLLLMIDMMMVASGGSFCRWLRAASTGVLDATNQCGPTYGAVSLDCSDRWPWGEAGARCTSRGPVGSVMFNFRCELVGTLGLDAGPTSWAEKFVLDHSTADNGRSGFRHALQGSERPGQSASVMLKRDALRGLSELGVWSDVAAFSPGSHRPSRSRKDVPGSGYTIRARILLKLYKNARTPSVERCAFHSDAHLGCRMLDRRSLPTHEL